VSNLICNFLYVLSISFTAFSTFLMIFLPRKKITEYLVHRYIMLIIVAAIYSLLLLYIMSNSQTPSDGFLSLFTLPGMQILLQSPYAMDLCVMHWVCFDLAAISWISRDSQLEQIKHVHMTPLYLLLIPYSPLALISYLIFKYLRRYFIKIQQA
jgi:hypothetical protein